MVKRVQVWCGALLIVFGGVLGAPQGVFAETLTSSNYKFTDTALGSGGLINSSSASYKGLDTVGDLSVGSSASSNFQIAAGHTTTNDPNLSFVVSGTPISFPAFSTTTAATATTTFSVLNYTSYGYIVQLVGTPPTNGTASISAIATNAASTVGTSQFGVNLVANTLPLSVGSNPDNGGFGFGLASTNYNTPNSYRFVSGETVAQAPKSSGVTNYTITYLVNVPALLPGGQYNATQTLIVTGTY
jgi:hypothetical protein